MNFSKFGACDKYEVQPDLARKWVGSMIGILDPSSKKTIPLLIQTIAEGRVLGATLSGDTWNMADLKFGFNYIPYPLDEKDEEFNGAMNVEGFPLSCSISRVADRQTRRGVCGDTTAVSYSATVLINPTSLVKKYTYAGYPDVYSKVIAKELFNQNKAYPTYKEALELLFAGKKVSVALSRKYEISLSERHSGLGIIFMGRLVGEITPPYEKLVLVVKNQVIAKEITKLCLLK